MPLVHQSISLAVPWAGVAEESLAATASSPKPKPGSDSSCATFLGDRSARLM